MLLLSELLHLVLVNLSPEKSADEVARAVSDAYGRELGVGGLLHLIDKRLAPMGLVHDAGADAAVAMKPPKADPLLALRLRGTVLPEKAVNAVASVLAPLFWPPVVVTVLVGLAVVDLLVLAEGGLMAALEQVLLTPGLLLGIVALLTAGAVIHELGHATACRYGWARPGVIGVGVYLVFPAFFTNVTDSYRLGRAGRIRTDLGGLYFNCLCLIALGGAYLLTGQGFFLLAAALMHFEMVQQLVPTLRFDGYFVLADIAGVPDLFNRIRPVLLSLVPGRPMDPRPRREAACGDCERRYWCRRPRRCGPVSPVHPDAVPAGDRPGYFALPDAGRGPCHVPAPRQTRTQPDGGAPGGSGAGPGAGRGDESARESARERRVRHGN